MYDKIAKQSIRLADAVLRELLLTEFEYLDESDEESRTGES